MAANAPATTVPIEPTPRTEIRMVITSLITRKVEHHRARLKRKPHGGQRGVWWRQFEDGVTGESEFPSQLCSQSSSKLPPRSKRKGTLLLVGL